jgi:hypothetical protein
MTYILWHVSWYMSRIRRVLVRMIEFISSWVTHLLTITFTYSHTALSLIYTIYRTFAYSLILPVSTSRLLAPALNTETTTVSHFKYYTQIGPSNHTSILRRLTSCFLLCWTELKLTLHSLLLIWNWLPHLTSSSGTLLIRNSTKTELLPKSSYITSALTAQKTQLYCCVTNIAPWTSHVTPSQYCWSVTSCACVEVFTEP